MEIVQKIPVSKDVLEVSKVDIDRHTCEDGSPVWIDLNVGAYKGENGNTTLNVEQKAEYVNKNLIKELWDKFWESDETDDQYKYVDALDYFLNN